MPKENNRTRKDSDFDLADFPQPPSVQPAHDTHGSRDSLQESRHRPSEVLPDVREPVFTRARVQFPVAPPPCGPRASVESPSLSPRIYQPKRRRPNEEDPIESTIDNYWSDEDEPIIVPAAKRPRFLQAAEALDTTGRLVVSQRCFRPNFGPLPPDSIRLLVLHPGEGDDPLSMTMSSRHLDTNPSYDALSYVWGNDRPLHPIVVFNRTPEPLAESLQSLSRAQKLKRLLDAKVSVFFVRKSLDAALRRIRKPPPKDKNGKVDLAKLLRREYQRVIWVDAICINQRDNVEKNVQLLRMPEIYHIALKVVVWLGEGSGSSQLSMDFINEIVQGERAGRITKLDITKNKVDSFLELMRCRWFARRWIIQEIFFARHAVIYYGKSNHHLDRFNNALARVMKDLRTPEGEMRKVAGLQPESLEKLEAYGANVLYKLRSELLDENDPSDKVPIPYQTLDYLVPRLIAFDAGDPRDIIYGVQNLARKTRTALPPVDYESSVLDVFVGFVKYAYEATFQLDMLCRHWAPVDTGLYVHYNDREWRKVRTELPSWIPQLDRSAFGPPKDIFLGRINGDPFVGETSPVYNASKGARDVEALFGLHGNNKVRLIHEHPIDKMDTTKGPVILREVYDGTLRVKGLVLGKVMVKSDRMIPEIIPRDVIAMGGWRFSKFEGDNKLVDVPDQLWKTLIAKKRLDGSDADIGDKHACLAMLKKEDIQGDIRIRDLLQDPEFSADDTKKKYLERARVVCWNRRVFLGGPCEEYFGICPDRTAVGDLICIVHGMSVPVILREVYELPELGFSERPTIEKSKLPKSKSPYHTPDPRSLRYGRSTPPGHRNSSFPSSSPTPIYHSLSHQNTLPLFPTPIYYRLIGECYINNMMDGQAMDNADLRSTEQSFILV